MTLPKYINRPTGYDLALPGPYYQRDVTMRCYAFGADKTALEKMCDRYLNIDGSASRYAPLSHHALMVFANMDKVSCADPEMGSMQEIDAALFVPVLRYEPGHLLPRGVEVFMPYLFVNSDWALVTGREGGLAFRKNLGLSFFDKTDSSGMPAANLLNHVEAWVVPERGVNSRLVRQRVIELIGDHEDADIDKKHDSPSKLMEQVLESIAVHIAKDPQKAVMEVVLASHKKASVNLPVVFLKQYRDAIDNTAAVMQEVFSANSELPLSEFRGGGFISGAHKLKFGDPVSHPIASELGVAADTELEVEFAFELDCDFTMDVRQ